MPYGLQHVSIPFVLRCCIVLAVCGSIASASAETSDFEPDQAGLRQIIDPFLRQHCLRCHGPEAAEGEFRVDQQLTNDFLDRVAKGKWGEVVNVLNSHEMPPEDEPQPEVETVARVVDWITAQLARAELIRRDTTIVLRRLNRAEYRNTIRDLVGVDFDIAGFPQDPPAGGFDNNGQALTLSPLHVELYFEAARKILDMALVEGQQPPSLRWRFEPDSGDSDSNRVTYDGQRVIVNGGKNRVQDGFKVMHHESWDRKLNARDFQLPYAGEYVIRIRAAGHVPDRAAVVSAAEKILDVRLSERNKQNPRGERWHREEMQEQLNHFETDPIYDYGPPRLKLSQNLGGQPRVLAEFDVPAPRTAAEIYEVRARFSTQKAGLTVDYAYSLPKVLENFWCQGHDSFARPELWVDWFEIEGPVYPSWPPPSHRQILFDSPLRETDQRAYARQVIARFMRRAYRRPVAASEVDAKLAFFDAAHDAGAPLVAAIKQPLIAILISPHFLYLAESTDAAPAESAGEAPLRPLNDYELASRLSYFLWSSMPDAALFELAAAGRLGESAVLTAEVDRLLADPKSDAFVRNFAGQWLGLREVGANPPAEDLFPRYDRHLEESMVGESKAFFAEILRNERSVMNLVDSDFVVVNERLARFYGMSGVRGDQFRPVALPEGIHRGGIVTQASVLTITSNGTRTSPVKRGTWVLKNLLGIDPGLPVANAGEIAPKVPGIDKATVRKRLEIHRQLPQCARCHNKIDPLGFALENFDASGRWRNQEGFGYKGRVGKDDPVIDASAKLPDGTEFSGIDGLQQVLLERDTLFLSCLADKLFTYALGRELGVVDQLHIRAAVKQMNERKQERKDTLRSLIQFIVLSEPFRTK